MADEEITESGSARRRIPMDLADKFVVIWGKFSLSIATVVIDIPVPHPYIVSRRSRKTGGRTRIAGGADGFL
jgi:hypothetical protein